MLAKNSSALVQGIQAHLSTARATNSGQLIGLLRLRLASFTAVVLMRCFSNL